MIETGYLLITDITGYTSFLTQSELDHAQHIIEGLFESQLEVIHPPLRVSNFQGDAILCYAAEAESDDGNAVFGQVEGIYQAFAQKKAAMQIAPPCHCRICSSMSVLDLKIFVHYGQYLVKKMGDREELMGSDVIVAHRLMKNKVKENTGFRSYLLVTDAAYEHLADADTKNSLKKHTESYEDIGEVEMFVAPLRPA
jgi:class 3 adenylate cyclase